MGDDPKVADEIERMKAEAILPAERRLVVWSLVLGVVLLGLLVWLSETYFPGASARPGVGP